MKGIFKGSIAENDDVEHALNRLIDYRASEKGKHLHGLLRYLNGLASKLCDLYDRTCCSKRTNKHFCFQCDNSVEAIIASFRQGGIFYDIEQIEEFIAYVIHSWTTSFFTR